MSRESFCLSDFRTIIRFPSKNLVPEILNLLTLVVHNCIWTLSDPVRAGVLANFRFWWLSVWTGSRQICKNPNFCPDRVSAIARGPHEPERTLEFRNCLNSHNWSPTYLTSSSSTTTTTRPINVFSPSNFLHITASHFTHGIFAPEKRYGRNYHLWKPDMNCVT